jgi:DNA invertase Pin-like site-specific DNA recombinase
VNGRVRPFTSSREVITFQGDRLPGVRYALEFRTLAQARAHFGVSTRRRSEAEAQAAEALRLKALGMTPQEIAGVLNVSRSTVYSYIKQELSSETFKNNN